MNEQQPERPKPAAPPPRRAPPPALAGRPAAPAPSGQPRARLRLADASTGLVREPLSILAYGVEAVGKTTFGANAPSPLIIGAERGSAEIGHAKRLSPTCLDDVMAWLDELRTEEHAYRSVVLDSLDWLEPLVHAATCARGGKPTIEAFGFGKGYIEALVEWRALLAALDALRGRGMHVILVAHAVLKTFKNPDATQGDYDRWTLKLHEKASALVKEWSKAVLFMNFERATVEVNDRTKGMDTGRRVIYTHMSAAYDAKNRLWLPPEITLGWAPFMRAVEEGRKLRERFYAAIRDIDEGVRMDAMEHVEKSNYDPAAIEQVIAGLTQKG